MVFYLFVSVSTTIYLIKSEQNRPVGRDVASRSRLEHELQLHDDSEHASLIGDLQEPKIEAKKDSVINTISRED